MAKAKAVKAEEVVDEEVVEVVEQFPATPGDTHTFVTDRGVEDPDPKPE